MFLNLVLGCSLIHVRYYISAIYSFVNLNVIVYILIQLQTQVRVNTDGTYHTWERKWAGADLIDH